MTGTMSRKRVVGAVLLAGVLGACGGAQDTGRTTNSFFNPQEIPLETYSAEQIYERGEFELNRKRPAKPLNISPRSNACTPIPNGPSGR